ncbi:phage tail tape measure C-terminal domain-containing protein [uncultured Pseudodesulfovibrio sp.]|uniref:phage tail tape measure C-terminal domain-containing protein n=1 Tax=uncultured Pseudodesulfovibrio sp. TaxID=2035858 RepID=UPI0029C7B0A8|nr:phage tail tape measure C-terminal domain-containing protein [uncultured Pseudodesulfovibrio sp.]
MAGNAGELYLQIRVDDKGSIKVKNLGKELKQTGKDGEDAFDRVDRKSRHLDGSLGNLRGTVGQLAAAFGTYQVLMAAKEVTLSAARYESLDVVLQQVGKNYGYNADELTGYTQTLQDGGIAMIESREVLLKMLQAEMDLTEARRLARIAQDAAVIGNVNSSQAFEQLVFGIQSAQVEVLRTIGINVNFERSYKDAAKAMGKTTTALTEHEKVQIRTNAVIKAGAGIAGAYESAMTTAGKKISSFSRYVDNFQVSMGKAFQPATVVAIDKATEAMKRLTEEVKDPEVQARLAGLAETGVETAENLFKIGTAAADFVGIVADGWNQLPEIIQQAGLVGALFGGKWFVAAMTGITFAIGQWNKVNGQINDVSAADKREALLNMERNRVKQLKEQYEQLRGSELETFGPKFQNQIAQSEGYIKSLQGEVNSIRASLDQWNQADDPRNRDWVTGIIQPWKANKVTPDVTTTTTDSDKIARAIDSITVKLAAMNDTGTDGEARIARLTKEYNGFAKTLGSDRAEVEEFAEVLAYANEHYGQTPAEVAKATRAIEENISTLEHEITAIENSTDSYGHVNQARLSMYQAEAEAEREYQDAVLDGVDPILAARQRDLTLQLNQVEAKKKNLQVQTEFSREYLKLIKGETEFKIAQIEEQSRVWREAGADAVAVAQWEKEAKLQISREWADGAIRAFRDYGDAATDAASQVEKVITNSLNSMEDALVEFAKTGKLEFRDLANSIIDDMLRMAIQQTITGPLSSGIGSFFGSILPNAHGGAYASPSLSRYEGQVVDRPTYFAFANGASMGVMGEADRAEVIAPLFRDPVTNDMGVKVHGAMGGAGIAYYYFYSTFEMPTPSGNREQDSAYLNEAFKQFEKQVRGWFNDEMRNAQRPGGQLNSGTVL